MYQIVTKRRLNDIVTLMEIKAPAVAAKAKPGQFIMFRLDEYGERVPLTISDYDPEKGTVTIVFQHMGRTTKMLAEMEVGDSIADFVGPMGKPSHLEGLKRVMVVGGGVGCAIAYPVAKALHKMGVHVEMIAGFKNKDIVILEDEMKNACSKLYLTTDDGSYGEKGFVTDKLKSLIEEGNQYDTVIAIGPVIMMKFVSAVTKPYNIRTVVSLNPIMIDATGMCGGCRVTVDGERKFACVDGPEFDGHKVDFDELMRRNAFYKADEQKANEHICHLTGGVRHG